MNLLSMTLMALVLFSCGGDGKKGGGKSLFTPVSSGRPYELLVVIDKDMWERPAGRALFNALDADADGKSSLPCNTHFPRTSPSFLVHTKW